MQIPEAQARSDAQGASGPREAQNTSPCDPLTRSAVRSQMPDAQICEQSTFASNLSMIVPTGSLAQIPFSSQTPAAQVGSNIQGAPGASGVQIPSLQRPDAQSPFLTQVSPSGSLVQNPSKQISDAQLRSLLQADPNGRTTQIPSSQTLDAQSPFLLQVSTPGGLAQNPSKQMPIWLGEWRQNPFL